jgi:hypothetical protein
MLWADLVLHCIPCVFKNFYHSQASLDDPTQTVVMHRSEPSRLQSLALQLADKVNNFVDSNERIFEMKSGRIC